MSEDLHNYLETIEQEIMSLMVYTTFLEKLFDSNNKIEILNNSSGTFFVYCQNMFIDSIVMRVSRLTDPEKQGKNENISIKSLYKDKELCPQEDHEKLNTLISGLEEQVEKIKIYRNKKMAHIDKATITNGVNISTGFSIDSIQKIEKYLEEIFNQLISLLPEDIGSYSPKTNYDLSGVKEDANSTSNTLLRCLEKGHRLDSIIDELPEILLEKIAPVPEDSPWEKELSGQARINNSVNRYISSSLEKTSDESES